ncbi:MAG: hypothetical protein JSV91_11225 [Phycisphaerales bacterium]|nr:MAG: hypothetical protein JSV91_11225 [Phycisphaerales bacterium]
MPLECPVCRYPFSRLRALARTAWSRWRCPSCESLLGISLKRRLIATLPWIVILVFLLLVLRIMSWGMWIAIPILVAAGLGIYMLFERIVVHERCGFRCRSCGYDLQGQVDPHCPECGRALDEDEIERMNLARPGELRQAVTTGRMGRWAAIILIALFTLAVLGQLVHLYYLRSSAFGPRQETKRVLDGVLRYAADHGGQAPAHALEHCADNCMIVLSFDSRTTPDAVPVPGGNLETLANLSPDQQSRIVEQAVAALPEGVIAHRLGDFVFPYHSIQISSADPDIWLVILWPDPDSNAPPLPDDHFYVGKCDGEVEKLRAEEFSAAIAEQNTLRAASGLPPLPHPATITHASPAKD